MAERLTSEERVRIHERIQEATGLITQAEDELPRDLPAKEELRTLGKRVWEIGYEILGAVRYSQVEELAQVIADLDEEQPFLDGKIDGVDLFDASPRRVAERILARLHGREGPPMAERPPNPYTVREGETWAARVDDDRWRLLPSDTEKRCRWGGNKPCGQQAVAELNRGHRPWTQPRDNWWAYCGEHLYGRWVEDGRVMEWYLVHDEAAS